MAELLPNLAELLAALPDTAVGHDAAALATAASIASSWPEAAQHLDALVRQWGAR